jgi:hypothetical protein
MGGATDDAERREERFHAERGNEKPMLSGTIGVTGAPHRPSPRERGEGVGSDRTLAPAFCSDAKKLKTGRK